MKAPHPGLESRPGRLKESGVVQQFPLIKYPSVLCPILGIPEKVFRNVVFEGGKGEKKVDCEACEV